MKSEKNIVIFANNNYSLSMSNCTCITMLSFSSYIFTNSTLKTLSIYNISVNEATTIINGESKPENTAKTSKKKRGEQSTRRAERSVRLAERSIRLAERSVRRTEQSTRLAEQSTRRNEKNVRRDEQSIRRDEWSENFTLYYIQ